MPLYAILKQKGKQKLQGKLPEHGDFWEVLVRLQFFQPAEDPKHVKILKQGASKFFMPAKVAERQGEYAANKRDWIIGMTTAERRGGIRVYAFLKQAIPRQVQGKGFDSRS